MPRLTIVLKRRWPVLLVATFLASVAAVVVLSVRQPTYEAQARLLVRPINTDFQTLEASRQLVVTYARLAESRPVRAAVARELGLDHLNVGEVSASPNDLTRILTIQVAASNPLRAAKVANALGAELASVSGGDGARTPGRIRVVEPARPPPGVSGPHTMVLVAIAGLSAFLIILIALVVFDSITDRVRDADEVAELTSAPSLGTLPMRKFSFQKTYPPDGRWGFAALASNVIARLDAHGDGGAPGSVALVSPDASSAYAAAALAVGLATRGSRVALIGMPTANPNPGAHSDRSLATLVTSRRAAAPVSRPTELKLQPRLSFFPLLLDQKADEVEQSAATILQELLVDFEHVVIAVPPVLASHVALPWCRAAQKAVIVALRDQTRRQALVDLEYALRAGGDDIIGSVLVYQVFGDMGVEGWPSVSMPEGTGTSVPAQEPRAVMRSSG